MDISWKKTFLISLISTLSVSLALFVFHIILSLFDCDIIPYYLSATAIIFVNATIFGLLFISYNQKLKQTLLATEIPKKSNYVFYFSLITLSVIQTAYSCFSEYRALLKISYFFFAIAAVSGILSIWLNKIEMIRKNIDNGNKLCKQIRIPIINYWIKVNRKDVLHLAIIFIFIILGLYLRAANLTNLEPYTDEYIHLINAKAIVIGYLPSYYIDGGSSPAYLRFFPLTLALSLIFKLFGYSIYFARLLGVLASVFTGYVLYHIFKKENRHLAIIISILWLISPWSIMISRNIREYAYMPIYFIVSFYLIFISINYFIQYLDARLSGSNPKIKIKYFIFILLPVVYALVDYLSTFKLVFLFYIVSFYYLMLELHRSNLMNEAAKRYIKKISLIFTIFLTIGFALVGSRFMNMLPSFNSYWMNIFFNNSEAQWFYNSNYLGFYVMFIIGLSVILKLFNRNGFKFLYLLATSFLVYFYFFTFHFSRYDRPRYGYLLLILILPIISVGILSSFRIISTVSKHKNLNILLYALVLLSIFNINNSLAPMNASKPGYVPITNEYHDSFLPVLKKYGKEINKNEPIICSLCFPFYWYDLVDFRKNKIFAYKYRDVDRFSKNIEIIFKYRHGWMILDDRRNNRWTDGYPESDIFLGGKSVKFIERLGTFYVYRW